MAAAVAIAREVGERRALGGLARATALDGRRVEQHDVVASTRALAREDPQQPLDRLRQPAAALVEARLGGQRGEQMAEALLGHGQKAPVARNAHDRLGDAERDHLGVRDAAAGVACGSGQEIVRRAINGGAESVEVGVHVASWSTVPLDTADFGLSALCPSITALSVESTV